MLAVRAVLDTPPEGISVINDSPLFGQGDLPRAGELVVISLVSVTGGAAGTVVVARHLGLVPGWSERLRVLRRRGSAFAALAVVRGVIL